MTNMRTGSPQYEYLPAGNEGHNVSNNDQHYSSCGHQQSHETVELNSLGWHADSVPESHQSFQHDQDSTIHGTADQNANQSFDSWKPKGTPSIDTQPLHSKSPGATFGRLSNWWWWELGSVALSLSCIVAIVVTLLVMQNKPLSSWHSSIAPNALISILVTISKASLLLVVTGCISQLKWLYFKHSTHSIRDLQTFDDASRGPLGALELLTRLSPTQVFSHRSAGAGWAFWASLLTILALALDPFAQQVLSFPLRSVSTQASSLASIYATQIYDTGNPAGRTASWGKNVDVSMQGAVMNGLYVIDDTIAFSCSTGNCTWPSFYTLGVCSSCTNVTGQTNATCIPSSGALSCNYTLPSGIKLRSGKHSSSGGGGRTTLNVTTKQTRNITDRLVDLGLVRIQQLEGWGYYDNPEAFDCSLSWCAKRYSKVGVLNGKMASLEIRSWPLGDPQRPYLRNNSEMSAFTIAENAEDFDGPNRTFTINTNDHNTLQAWLTDTFFQTQNQESVARALFSEPNTPYIIANIASSMTNNIRQGRNATIVEGTVTREETYIHVNWSWLVLPGAVVLMGIVLLAATMWSSRGESDGLWKNSILATMFMQTRGWDGQRVGTWSDMAIQAKAMKGKLERNERGGFDFVRS